MTATTSETLSITPLQIGPRTLTSRLIVGTGKYESYELMQDALLASGCDITHWRMMSSYSRTLGGPGVSGKSFTSPMSVLPLPSTVP